jgi:hypothetical protein
MGKYDSDSDTDEDTNAKGYVVKKPVAQLAMFAPPANMPGKQPMNMLTPKQASNSNNPSFSSPYANGSGSNASMVNKQSSILGLTDPERNSKGGGRAEMALFGPPKTTTPPGSSTTSMVVSPKAPRKRSASPLNIGSLPTSAANANVKPRSTTGGQWLVTCC